VARKMMELGSVILAQPKNASSSPKASTLSGQVSVKDEQSHLQFLRTLFDGR
jgi:hypothetical protein